MDIPITNELFQESARTAQEAMCMLVLANRVLANEKVFDAFGHVSVRNPENPNTFFISRALSPELVTMDDMLELDFEGRIVSGNPEYKPFNERAIHCAVYEARPDVMCVCHPHPHELIPFASCDVPLKSIYHQDVTFYEGIPVFKDLPPECGLLINTLPIARKMAAELGNCRGILIRNHGVVVVGESIPRAVYSSVTLCDSAKILLNTLSMGASPHYLSRDEMEVGTVNQFTRGIARTWNLWCTKAKESYPEIAHIQH
ncbi:MAG: class II aldolase/adducin family protein [Oscillospiraceae bacterium]|nr:class II aldolase/adducin family protein [Oscillospiraceae bacterium]